MIINTWHATVNTIDTFFSMRTCSSLLPSASKRAYGRKRPSWRKKRGGRNLITSSPNSAALK